MFKRRQSSSNPTYPLANKLELLSFHIPKTGGTSLRNILVDEYGEKGVWRLDSPLIKPVLEFKVNQKAYVKHKFPDFVKVVHGHFRYANLKKILDIPEDIPKITWLRDPVERVISNYFYLSKRLHEELEEEAKSLNILSKMERSLMEYASQEVNQNRMSKFLEGLDLKEMTFVGILEHKKEDLQYLCQKMNWSPKKDYWHNPTGKSKRQVSAADREQIRRWNAQDETLYQQALKLRITRK